MAHDWKTYSQSVTLTGKHPKTYGTVKRHGRIFYRNYHREIKGGISFIELVEIKQQQMQEAINKQLESSIYEVLR